MSEQQDRPVYTGAFLQNPYGDSRHRSVAPEPTQGPPSLGATQSAPLRNPPGYFSHSCWSIEGLPYLPYAFDPSVPPPSFGCPPPGHLANMEPPHRLNAFGGPQLRAGPPAPYDGFQSVFPVSGDHRLRDYNDYSSEGRLMDVRTKRALQRKQDALWVKRFCQSRAEQPQVPGVRQPRPHQPDCDLRETLYGAAELLSALEKLHTSLKDNVDNDRVWTDSQLTVSQLKTAFQDKVELLREGDRVTQCKGQLCRVARRRGRARAAKRLQQQEERERQEAVSEKEAVIDVWRMKRMNQVQEKIKEQELKLTADLVLCEVRKKQADVKRMQNVLRSLEKLRRLRKEAATRKGIISEQESDEAFSSRMEWLVSVMKRRTVIYSAEEKALMVMLEGEQEEERRRKQEGRAKEETETQLKNKQRMDAILFGGDDDDDVDSVLLPFRKYYTQAQRSLHALIRVRKEWDVFTVAADHPDGSPVPESWIFPDPPSHQDWASTLLTD